MLALEDHLLRRVFEQELWDLAQRVDPDIIHAHSPYRCGVPAARVAARMGVPLVYEVRGFWEESGVASGLFRRGGPKYRFWRRMDSEAMLRANAVVCICEELRKAIIERGVSPAQVFVVPNAVDTDVFRPSTERGADGSDGLPEEVKAVRKRLHGGTLGYVGSIRRLEGVGELVRAAGEMVRRGCDISVLVIGDGPDLDGLVSLAAEEGIADRAVFTGRVPHEQVRHYYNLIDVFVISRPPTRVAKLVTPLKPLEAMAMGKALVMPDLPALREIVRDGETGLLYAPGEVADLADKCTRLLEDKNLNRRVTSAGTRWARDERNWPTVLRRLEPVYRVAREMAEAGKQ